MEVKSIEKKLKKVNETKKERTMNINHVRPENNGLKEDKFKGK